MQNLYKQAIKIPAESHSGSGQVISVAPVGRVMLDKPIPAQPISLLSARPLTESQTELGKKIAAKHGLTE